MSSPLQNWSHFHALLTLIGRCRNQRIKYSSDAIFCILILFNNKVHLRHKYGVFTFLPFLCFKLLKCFTCKNKFPESSVDSTILINSISTPAHEGSWQPLWRELACDTSASKVALVHPESGGLHFPSGNSYSGILHRPSDFVRCSFIAVFIWLRLFSLFAVNRFLLKLLCKRSTVIIEHLFSFLLFEKFYKRALFSCQTLVTTYELSFASKGLIYALRARGKRVIHIMHGQRLPTYQITMATDLVLFSKIDEPWFRARVDPSVRIWTVGHPRLEDVRRQVGPPRDTINGLPRITFFSQPAEGDYSRSRRIADWQICAFLQGKAEVRFRAHPRDDRALLATDMKAAGIAFMQVSDAGLIDDLKWCDAVASSWSTVSMEAAACGRGIFWTCSTPEEYEASQELRDNGIGVLIQNAPDWAPYLRQWTKGGWQSPVTVPEEQLRELGMIGDTSKSWMERLEIEVATLSPMIEG